MSVRVKVVCSYKSTYGDTEQIQLSPVYSGSEENKAFWASTPGGQFAFYTVNKDAASRFEMGKEYYMDIFEAS